MGGGRGTHPIISPRFLQPLQPTPKYIPLSTLYYLQRTFSLVEYSPYNSLNLVSFLSVVRIATILLKAREVQSEELFQQHNWSNFIVNYYAFLDLTLILLTWTIWRAPTNASKWRMGFNSAFKGLIAFYYMLHAKSVC